MKTRTDPQIAGDLPEWTSPTVLTSLPKLEDLPEPQRQELIQALAALLLHDPDLQALLETRHEPEQ
jgi:hypothetical protein